MEPSQDMELIFLGTGTSHGVPMIGCDCAVCRSDDPRDRRNRAAAAVRMADGRVILIDAPPELRLAAVAAGLDRVDAILFTHAHADHIMGLDDVRRFNDLVGGTIPAYGSAQTLKTVRAAFGYAEVAHEAAPANRPSLRLERMDAAVEICGRRVQPVPLLHGADEILGFRMGSMAYCTDCSAIPPASEALLEGLDLLVIDALRHRPHPSHFTLAEALETIARIGPKRALLTHLTHELPHAETAAQLPQGVDIAYDLLRVKCG
jgi:phosphoribosyl 1,2-cyclic phosphate phosphodiesterase